METVQLQPHGLGLLLPALLSKAALSRGGQVSNLRRQLSSKLQFQYLVLEQKSDRDLAKLYPDGCPACWMNPTDHDIDDCPEHAQNPTSGKPK